MKFKCVCTLAQSMVGDGCQICNTELAIDCIPQPDEIAEQLMARDFSAAQSYFVAEQIFLPLVSLIATLNNKIDQLAAKV